MSRVREIEHELGIETDVNRDLPAMLDERAQNVVQMDKLAEATVEPGLFRIPGCMVTSSPESKMWNIAVDHPTAGELNFRYKKPTTEGWVEGQELVDLLDWYGVHDYDPYQLQTKVIYIAHIGDASDSPHGWEIAMPPWAQERRSEAGPGLLRRAGRSLAKRRPTATMGTMWWAMLFWSVVVASGVTVMGSPSAFQAGVYALVAMLIASVLSAIGLSPPEDDP